jgi:hypothetical protein
MHAAQYRALALMFVLRVALPQPTAEKGSVKFALVSSLFSPDDEGYRRPQLSKHGNFSNLHFSGAQDFSRNTPETLPLKIPSAERTVDSKS